MGVLDGVIIRFSWLIGEVRVKEAIAVCVDSHSGQHSIIYPTVEVVGPKLVDPWRSSSNFGARLMCHSDYIIYDDIVTS